MRSGIDGVGAEHDLLQHPHAVGSRDGTSQKADLIPHQAQVEEETAEEDAEQQHQHRILHCLAGGL